MTRPKITCLVGSAKLHRNLFDAASRELTLKGIIVLGMPFWPAPDPDSDFSEAEIAALKPMLQHKIDLADSLHVINHGGYIGESTAEAIAHAIGTNKPIAFSDIPAGEKFIEDNTPRLAQIISQTMMQPTTE